MSPEDFVKALGLMRALLPDAAEHGPARSFSPTVRVGPTPIPTTAGLVEDMAFASVLSATASVVRSVINGLLTFPELAAFVRQLVDIVDSGASRTYVGGDTPLEDETPGVGWVSVANGQREPIAGIGTYGSITGARRVGKFPRTLVSVTDLIEQFGSVIFDTKGVHVLTRVPGAGPLATTIGSRTASRLFSFDAPSLTVHAEALRGAGVGASDPEDLRPRLGTMGVRWSPVPNNGLSWASLDRLRGVAPVAAR